MRSVRKILTWLVLIGVLSGIVFALAQLGLLENERSSSLSGEIPPSATEATLETVYDGDTIAAVIDGQRETVRLIGINAPETGGNNTQIECFGAEATVFLRSLIPVGATVWLEKDVSERDRFGRLLRFVWVVDADGRAGLTNHELVRNGYAVARIYPPDDRYADLLADGQSAARSNNLGMWGTCQQAHLVSAG